jgi:hypothetical protein
MPNVTVNLSTPIEGHEGQIKSITLREPKFGDVMALGEPSAFARSEGGMVFQSEKDGVVQSYVERLLVEPKDPALLLQVSLADALKLKDAIYDFFQAARAANSQAPSIA